jgi:hypothetical protein
MEVTHGKVYVSGTRIHVIVEVSEGLVPLHIMHCHIQGALNIHNGPLTHVLCNKLNMALISTYQDAEVFSKEERELIRRHVPWTRRVANEQTDCEGAEVDIPEFVSRNRDCLVLKKAIGSSGNFVVAGPSKTQAEWDQALRLALEEDDWIVQKFVTCPPVLYQHGASGCCPHNVIWGLFAFGEEYSGAFLRVLPQETGKVVNRQRGSIDGVVLEVE